MADETVWQREKRIRNAALTMGQTFYLVTLNQFVGRNATAWPSQTTIANAMNATPRAVRNWQTELETIGVLQVDVGKGRSSTNRYTLNLEAMPQKEESGSAFSPESEINEELSSALMRNHVPINAEPRSYRKNKKEHKKEQAGNSPNSLARPARKLKANADGKLQAFCLEWNNWHSAGIVGSKIRDTSAPGKTIADAWNRSQRDPEQRGRLENTPGLKAAIEASQKLLKPAGWFDAAGLIGGKNSNHRWYAEQLMAGTYRDKTANAATASPEVETAWQNVLDAIQEHSRFKPDQIEAAVGDRAWQAVKSIGLKKIDESSKFERQELKPRFIQAFKGTETA
jgi:hypothetical protein